MPPVSLQIPQVNQPDATEDPKIAADFTTLQTLLNGNLDADNIAAGVIPTAGSWQSLTLGTGIVALGYTPSCRLDGIGSIVRLKGTLITTATTSATWPASGSGSTWLTIPTGFRPTQTVVGGPGNFVGIPSSNFGYAYWTLTTAGQFYVNWSTNASITGTQIVIPLDGVTFTLS